MVVRFDLEGGAPALADIDDAGVLARRHDYAFALCWQAFQMNARRLVRAMLRPHHREHAELDQVRLAAEQFFNACEFFGGEIVSGESFGCDSLHEAFGST